MMTLVLVDNDKLQKLERAVRDLNPNRFDDKRKQTEAEEIIDAMLRSTWENQERAPSTIEIASDQFVKMHADLAKAAKQKDKIAFALADVWSFIPESYEHKGPLVSENFLYESIGKDAARTFMSLLGNVASAADLDPFYDVEHIANHRISNATVYQIHFKFANDQDIKNFRIDFRDFINKNIEEGECAPTGRFNTERKKDGKIHRIENEYIISHMNQKQYEAAKELAPSHNGEIVSEKTEYHQNLLY